MTKRIMIVADSMAMPRSGVSYEHTWVYKLSNFLNQYEIIDKSRRASTTERLITEGVGEDQFKEPPGSDLLEFYKPNIVILQLGITDCAPRYIKRKSVSGKIVNSLPQAIRGFVYRIIKLRKRKRKYADVSKNEFKLNLENYVGRAKKIGAVIYIIEISPVGEYVLLRNPQINKSIEEYNKIFSQIDHDNEHVKVISPFNEDYNIENCTTDGYHLNERGHSIVYNELETFFKTEIN